MSVRAKFYVTAVERTKGYNGKELSTIKLNPVTSGSDENKKFYDASPCGNIHLGTVNPEAANQFELGKEYYVDFTPAA